MARAGVLYSQVAKAAAALAAAGSTPTVDTVRAAIGSGSKSTIGPMLKKWRAEHQTEAAAAGAGLPADLLEAVQAVHARMEASAQAQVDELQAKHEEREKELERERAVLREDMRRLDQERDKLATELSLTKAELAHARAGEQQAAVKLASLQAEREGLTQRLADRSAEVKTLADQLNQAHGQFEHYQDSIAAQRAEERRVYEGRIARLEQDLVGAQRHITAQQVTIGRQEEAIAHQTVELERLGQGLKDAQEALSLATAAQDRLADRLKYETDAKTRLLDQISVAQQQLAEARIELAGRVREIELQGEQMRHSENRATQLEDEKATWLRERGALEQRLVTAEQKVAELGDQQA